MNKQSMAVVTPQIVLACVYPMRGLSLLKSATLIRISRFSHARIIGSTCLLR